MSSEEQWARIVEAVARPDRVPSPDNRGALLQSAISLAGTAVADIVGCSVTQAVQTDHGTGYRTPVASNELAVMLDRVQYAADDGPCIAACRDGLLHSVAVMTDERAFAGFTAAAVANGVHSSLSLPLPTAQPSALNLYAAEPLSFTGPRPRAAAAFLSRCVAGLLSEALPQDVPSSLTATSTRRRELVQRACVVIAEREGASHAAAFHRLTVLSREQQLGVFEVARNVVDPQADGGQRS